MYKLEMHLHTLGGSPCAMTGAKDIAQLYASNHYDGIVCTNHFNRYLCDNYYNKGSELKNVQYWLGCFHELKKECSTYDIDVFLGMELLIDSLTYYKPNPPYAEMLIYGISEEWLLSNPYKLFALSLEELYETCKKNNWIISQAHPFRDKINVQSPIFLEGAEFFNGHPHQQNHNDLAKEFVEKNNLLKTCGTDFHCTGVDCCGVYLENPIHSNEQLVTELRKRTHKPFYKNGIIIEQ